MYPIRVIDDVNEGWEVIPAGALVGTRDKWLATSPDGKRYFFKEPSKGTGEHWMEKAASEIGKLLGLDMINVDLARWQGRWGALIEMWEPARTVSGRQLLEDMFQDYDSQADYTYQKVRDALIQIGLLEPFHDMLVLDTLIDNLDRHDENWEVRPGGSFLPYFDNANCFIVFFGPERQGQFVGRPGRRQNLFGDETFRSAIRWEGRRGARQVTPLRLVREIRHSYPEALAASIRRVVSVPLRELQDVFDELPYDAIDEACRQLAKETIADRYGALWEVLQ